MYIDCTWIYIKKRILISKSRKERGTEHRENQAELIYRRNRGDPAFEK